MTAAEEPTAYDVGQGRSFCSMVVRKSERDEETTSYRVTFPADLELSGVIRRRNTVNWFCDLEQQRILVADAQKTWEEQDRFYWVGASNVSAQRVTTIPKNLFTGGIFDISPHIDMKYAELADMNERAFCLRAKHLYYAVSPLDCLSDYAAFLVPVEDFITLFDEAVQAAGMSGGRELAERFVDESELSANHSLSIDKCLENAQTDPDYWPELDEHDEPVEESVDESVTEDAAADGAGDELGGEEQ